MNCQNFEKDIIDLCTADKFDEAERRKLAAIPWLKQAIKTDFSTAKKVLTLFSELVGEAESFENFCNLIDELKNEQLISDEFAEELIRNAPANRWLD